MFWSCININILLWQHVSVLSDHLQAWRRDGDGFLVHRVQLSFSFNWQPLSWGIADRAVTVPLQHIHKQQRTKERNRKNHSDLMSLLPFLGFGVHRGSAGNQKIQTKKHYNQRSFLGICAFHDYLNETGDTRSVLMGHVFGDWILTVWNLIG